MFLTEPLKATQRHLSLRRAQRVLWRDCLQRRGNALQARAIDAMIEFSDAAAGQQGNAGRRLAIARRSWLRQQT